MFQILRTVRARLISDVELTGMVNADDITSGHNAEYANYPCIALSIAGGGSSQEFYNVTHARLNIDVYSNKNKMELWIIYERIKYLLLNQGLQLSDSIHSIYEIKVRDNQYESRGNVWHLSAQYVATYSTGDQNLFTSASGVVYVDGSLVKALPSMEIATFSGLISLDISFERNVGMERERFGKAVYYHSGVARLIFSEMIFKTSVLQHLWNIDTETLGKLNDGITTGVVYQVSQNSFPAYLQVLFQMVKSDDGKKLEIQADKAVCESLNIPFSKKDFCIMNCEWTLLGDSSGNVVKVAVES